MESGISYYLKKMASELFIKYDSEERGKIDRSIDNIFNKLEEYFDDQIDETIVFGSYSRDTILPRRYDANSDIDILVQFNTENYGKLRPESYRNQLKKFAQINYASSIVLKDHPSVVLELNHIKFDLVPAYFDNGFFYDSIEIPDKNGGWMETEPDEFSRKVTKSNTKYNSIVKPIIRLLKYWNASHDYPYYSYELEKTIVGLDFSGDNHQTGFFHAISNLPNSYLSNNASRKLESLKDAAKRIKNCLIKSETGKAYDFLGRILPQI
jgi:predicted nucleotidyltransferase